MNKLSNKSIEKFKIFLNNKEFGYISLTRHEFKILFNIYNSVIPLISEAEEKENRLIKYLEDKIKECKNNFNINKTLKQIEINTSVRNVYQDILERLKSGKYE